MPEPTLTPVPGAEVRTDDDGNPIIVIATCGVCGRSWNDAAVSAVTPVPSARCPFEHLHPDAPDTSGLRVITVKVLVRADDAAEVADGIANLACHDASLGAYWRTRTLDTDDLRAFGDVIDDLED